MMKLSKTICITALIFITVSLMTGGAQGSENKEAERLIIKRTDIMKSILSGDTGHEKGIKELKNIEEGSLLNDDIAALNKMKDTDYDIIESVDVISMIKTKQISDMSSYEAHIQWKYIGYNGIYFEDVHYKIGCKTYTDGIKLVSMEIIQ